MNPVWREHFEALKRSNLLDIQRVRAEPSDYSRALQWLSETWEFAAMHSGQGEPGVSRDEHLRDLDQLRKSLAQARLTP